MEEVILRFPHIAQQIFEELDDGDFIWCKVISQSWKNFIEENKFAYIKLIKALTNCSQKAMKKFFLKANLEDIIRLNSDVSKVYNVLLKANVYDPSLKSFHLAAQDGYLLVCQIIIQLASDSGHSSIIMKIKEEPVEQVDSEEGLIELDIGHHLVDHVSTSSIVEQEIIQAPLPKKIKLACQLIVNNTTEKVLKINNGRTPIQLASDSRLSSIIMKIKEEAVEQVNIEERHIVLDMGNYLVRHVSTSSIVEQSNLSKNFCIQVDTEQRQIVLDIGNHLVDHDLTSSIVEKLQAPLSKKIKLT